MPPIRLLSSTPQPGGWLGIPKFEIRNPKSGTDTDTETETGLRPDPGHDNEWSVDTRIIGEINPPLDAPQVFLGRVEQHLDHLPPVGAGG